MILVEQEVADDAPAFVIPAKQSASRNPVGFGQLIWIPAFAGIWRLDVFDAQSRLSLDCAGRAERRRRFVSVAEQRLWMRFPALSSDPKRRRASLAAAVQKTLPTQGSASLAEPIDSTRSVCLTWPRWERGRLARPGAANGRCSGLRPRLRTGRPRSQGGFAAPKTSNLQIPAFAGITDFGA
jgi:hypothetical protein